MEQFVSGYNWKSESGNGPRIASAIEWKKPINSRKESVHQLPLWVLDYTMSEGMRCRVSSALKPFVKRNINVAHLYAPKTRYWEDVSMSAEKNFHEAWITFWGAEGTDIEKFVENKSHFASFEDPHRILEPLFRKTAEYGKLYGPEAYWKAQSMLFRFFDILINSSERKNDHTYVIIPDKSIRRNSTLTVRVNNYLKTNMSRNILLEEIAYALNVSVSQLSHSYHKETGESPMRTHAKYRMAQIKNMLFIGDSLKTIASEMGFCDIYHLSKFFKKHEGISPRKFLLECR